jgi:subtilisin-like proprotein convertase family protein
MRRIRTRTGLFIVLACVAAAAAAVALATPYTNSTTINILDSADCTGGCDHPPMPASPYPSDIVVSGEATITKVTATLHALSHTFARDIDLLLAGPTGATVTLMSDTGGGAAANNVNLKFDDSASSFLPSSTLTSGTYKPTDLSDVCNGGGPASGDQFPAPAPGGPYGSMLSVFNGTNPNGTWRLYVVDDCHVDTGVIQGGWTVDINPVPTAVYATGFHATAARGRVSLSWRAASESEIAGFDVYRVQGHRSVRVNTKLVAARGSVAGARYSLVDWTVRSGQSYTYRLQIVKLDGARTWAGSSSLRAR